jgi:transcriptional regulator with XRE-family HTH domain
MATLGERLRGTIRTKYAPWEAQMDLGTVGKTVRARREAIGLTQERLAKLAKLSRQTVQRLEAGTIKDLSFGRISNLLTVIGLSFDGLSLTARQKKRGLWMAAKTSGVSYRGDLSEHMLEQTLATGIVPPGFEAHIGHLLDEAPVEYVVMAVEETAQQQRRAPSEIWSNVSYLALQLSPNRKNLWI